MQSEGQHGMVDLLYRSKCRRMTEHDLALPGCHPLSLREIQRIFFTKNHLRPWPLSTVPATGYGTYRHQEAMALDWARAAQRCQLHHQSCNPLDPRRKAEAWSTEGNLAKNCGNGNEEDEPHPGHHPEAGQWQAGLEELRCYPIRQLAWRAMMMMMKGSLQRICQDHDLFHCIHCKVTACPYVACAMKMSRCCCLFLFLTVCMFWSHSIMIKIK